MATITARKNKSGLITSYTIRVFMCEDADGKRHYETTSFKVKPEWKETTARKKAEAFAATFERDIKTGALSNEKRTFEAYAKYVIDLKAATKKCKVTTIDNYKYILRTIAPYIGYIKLKDLRPDHLNRLYMGFLNGEITGRKLQPKTLQNTHGFISAVLEEACREGLVVNNAARRATPPKIVPKAPASLEIEQLQKLLDTLKDEPMRWQAPVLLLINTGIRRGELLGLKWDKVDLNAGTIEIANNLVRVRETHELREDTPKTKMSNRIIRIPSDMVAFLRQYKAWQNEEQRLRFGEYFIDQGFVFTQDNGNPVHPETLSDYFGKLSKKSGIHVYAHLLRHTQASILIAKGMPINSVSKRLGHSQTSTTMNIYAHALKNADEDNVKVLESVLYGKS